MYCTRCVFAGARGGERSPAAVLSVGKIPAPIVISGYLC
ncbi:hypothetical protein TPASS_0232 [Treponema pallidum subsp. pallidum SS14]|uniref:Uncharacterized protein TP_0232 n=2 Tax=Treponema pallidum subsp. pallidum TaxID=161 RepID=Y232_TREPA|nr:RecName: Full=Uncharacterized protein TP_0232 [Treponema pallidum subsp. pallidum str. Nichols]AAC65231.1 predicted coding region TP0232 [Treponema pallidum subsp. pallidum str. Nichols]ACD70658.1 hypothetical protein TPASS_0232 [Treponema pallidum subsp. pallidum SS14]